MTPERRLDILIRTRELIAHPSQWGQGTFTQQSWVDRFLMRPPRICVMGAVQIACNEGIIWTAEVAEIHDWLLRFIPARDRNHSAYGIGVMSWQDRRTHRDVLALVDTAILEAQMALESAQRPNEPDDRAHDEQNEQDCPQHGSDSTRDGWEPCVKVDCPPLTEHFINYVVPPHDCDHEF
jgi:hypothetical protein